MGRKSNPPGTVAITFNVQKETFAYLTELIAASSIGGDEEKVAQHIFEAAMIEAEETGKYEIKRRASKALEKTVIGKAKPEKA
jgi:hypothetical protein